MVLSVIVILLGLTVAVPPLRWMLRERRADFPMLVSVMSGVAISNLGVISDSLHSVSSRLPLLATVFILASLGFRGWRERDVL